MAQHDYDITNSSGSVVRADLNDVLEAIASGNSGTSAPAVTFPFMRWFDTTNGVLKIRNAANNAWIVAFPDYTVANMGLAALGTQTFTGLQKFTKGADIASASPLVIGTDGNYFDVTGTTGFSVMTVAAGALFVLQFDGALTMTDGASIDLGGNNITTAAGDRAIFYATAANTVQLIAYCTEGNSPKNPSQAEAEAGTATIPRPWSAERVKQAITALGGGSVPGELFGSEATATAAASMSLAIPAGYDVHDIVCWMRPVTDGVRPMMEFSTDGGSSWTILPNHIIDEKIAAGGEFSASGGNLLPGGGNSRQSGNDTDNFVHVHLTAAHLATNGRRKFMGGEIYWVGSESTGLIYAGTITGYSDDTNDFTHVRFRFHSGNIAEGRCAINPKRQS